MPRGPRIDAPGLLQHVIARGIERSVIFKDDNDRSDFLRRLGELLLSHDTQCFAWALLSNHFHLLLRIGKKPLSSLMRRLLTGYAVRFNTRHQRSGHLFQNRYKSIVCEEDTYLLELIAYIHLNPLRAGLLDGPSSLNQFPWSGHTALMGTKTYSWQETDEVLAFFGKQKNVSRRNYLKFMIARLDQGKHSDLSGGGLIRSAQISVADSSLNNRSRNLNQAFDERILGPGDFVEKVLKESEEKQKKRASRRNITADELLKRVADYYGIPAYKITSGRKQQEIIRARSVFSYFAKEYLNTKGTELAGILKISPPAVAISVIRGESIAMERGDIQEFIFQDGNGS